MCRRRLPVLLLPMLLLLLDVFLDREREGEDLDRDGEDLVLDGELPLKRPIESKGEAGNSIILACSNERGRTAQIAFLALRVSLFVTVASDLGVDGDVACFSEDVLCDWEGALCDWEDAFCDLDNACESEGSDFFPELSDA